MPGPTAKTNPWADELKKSRRRSRKGLSSVSDEEWGEDDDWEWEAEPEPEEIEPVKNFNGNVNVVMNGIVNNSHKNGCLSNGTSTPRKTSVINQEDEEIEEVTGKADIKIQGNLLTIKRNGPIDWSDDEYEEDEEDMEPPAPPAPPPPPPVPPPPPPMPPVNVIDEARQKKLERIEAMKRKPTVKPDWGGLMQDICSFRFGHSQRLKRVKCNDRSKPMLSDVKIQGKFIYDSEKKADELDIFFEIKKGVKLKHVKTNDRSKPMLSGIKCFRRQQTKEDKMKLGYPSMDESIMDMDEDDEDMDKLRDDLESTKQLLELEVRSKKLLEKDNKRLAQELEKLKQELTFGKGSSSASGVGGVANQEVSAEVGNNDEVSAKARRNSVIAAKRHSVIRLLSESESHDVTDDMDPPQPVINGSDIEEREEEEEEDDEEEQPVEEEAEEVIKPPNPNDKFYEEEIAEIEEMREEVDEARKLAEEWEAKYKEMQRQMSELESSRYKKHSLIIDSVAPMIQKKASVTSEFEDGNWGNDDDGDYTWMLRREIHTLNNKLKMMRDKRDIVIRERYLLQERIETLVGSIGNELESRKRLRKEINEMNEAFKQEMQEMMAEQKAAEELEECYFSDDEDLVVNTHKKDQEQEEEWVNYDGDDDDLEESVEDIVNQVEEDEAEEDPGAELFDNYPLSDCDGIDESEIGEEELEDTRESLNAKVEKHNEKVQLMRRSNFMLKAKIDRLYDILQSQKEKHLDMRQELSRMLADIQ